MPRRAITYRPGVAPRNDAVRVMPGADGPYRDGRAHTEHTRAGTVPHLHPPCRLRVGPRPLTGAACQRSSVPGVMITPVCRGRHWVGQRRDQRTIDTTEARAGVCRCGTESW